ncbi:MAG: ABC transporter substrate-binding protein, partial [Wenzhouxiangellaceae bacterium]
SPSSRDLFAIWGEWWHIHACDQSSRPMEARGPRISMRKRTLTAGLAALLLAVGIGNAIAEESAPVTTIASAVYLGDVPTMVAEERGFFADHDIQAEVTHQASGVLSMAKLRAGEADFALMALTPFVIDRLADENPGGPDDPVILASLVHSTGLMQIVARDDSGIRQPADFRGRRIAVERGTNSEFVWWLFEQYHGIARASIELVDLSFAEMSDALMAGRIDAAVLVEPRVSKLTARLNEDSQSGAVRFRVDNIYVSKWILVTTRRTAQERRELCRRMLSAYRKAIEYIDLEADESIAIFNERMGVTEGLLAEHWDALDYQLALDWGLIAALQKQFLWGQTVGYGNAGGSLRILDLIEPGPLREVDPDAVRLPRTEPAKRAP